MTQCHRVCEFKQFVLVLKDDVFGLFIRVGFISNTDA